MCKMFTPIVGPSSRKQPLGKEAIDTLHQCQKRQHALSSAQPCYERRSTNTESRLPSLFRLPHKLRAPETPIQAPPGAYRGEFKPQYLQNTRKSHVPTRPPARSQCLPVFEGWPTRSSQARTKTNHATHRNDTKGVDQPVQQTRSPLFRNHFAFTPLWLVHTANGFACRDPSRDRGLSPRVLLPPPLLATVTPFLLFLKQPPRGW